MRGYWDQVPVGIWSITDTEDALEILKDEESTFHFSFEYNWINVFGPDKKAAIIDLNKILPLMSSEDAHEFLDRVGKIVSMQAKVV